LTSWKVLDKSFKGVGDFHTVRSIWRFLPSFMIFVDMLKLDDAGRCWRMLLSGFLLRMTTVDGGWTSVPDS